MATTKASSKKPAVKKPATKRKTPTRKLGMSPVGNPGYSFAAPKWNWWKMRYEPVGIVWVGKPGGDTLEAREAFKKWLHDQNGFINIDNLLWRDKLPS